MSNDSTPMRIFSGTLNDRNANLKEALQSLSITRSQYIPPEMKIKSQIGSTTSPYEKKFTQGATLVPRALWFVKIVADSAITTDAHSLLIKTDDSLNLRSPWNTIRMSQKIEKTFIYATLLGQDIMPFCHLPFRIVLIPGLLENNRIKLFWAVEDLERLGSSSFLSYFKLAEQYWKNNRTKRCEKYRLSEWINYRQKLTKQIIRKAGFKVLFISSAANLAACVIDQKQPIRYEVNGIGVEPQGFVVESKTYWFETDNENEAHYICAILNSPIIDQLIKPVQSRGLWGTRDIHKRPLSIPFPLYNEKNKDHQNLARLAKACSKIVQNKRSKLINHSSSTGKRRIFTRKLLTSELQEIDSITKRILRL
ncbi:MAG: hypothetical protein ACFFC7_02210 [Candidatus Hermodarchaeota archaeon]